MEEERNKMKVEMDIMEEQLKGLEEERTRKEDERIIREIIEHEAEYVLAGLLDEASGLFDENASIRDAAHNKTWSGKKEISERYRDLPTFKSIKHEAIKITFSQDGTYAIAIASTVGIIIDENGIEQDISSIQGEQWTIEKILGEWKIISFTYGIT